MEEQISMSGQWAGFYEYGEGYSEKIKGERGLFRMFIHDFGEGQFAGTGIDLEGTGSLYEQFEVKGFVLGDMISFTKRYEQTHYIDEDGEITGEPLDKECILFYTGTYEPMEKKFWGEWEIRAKFFPLENRLAANAEEYVINTGTWEIQKDD